jgi:putative CocE/NonD family hydrolase
MARESRELARDPRLRAAFEAACGELPEWLRRLPLAWEATPLRLLPAYQSWFLELLRHADYDDYWKHPGWNLAEHLEVYPDIPLVLQTSWYGHHVWSTTEKFRRLRERLREPVKLLIGPWLHGYDDYARSYAGEVDFGANSALDLNELKLRFFDQSLKGHATGLFEEPPVRLFVMGGGSGRRNEEGRLEHGGRWRDEGAWPLARARGLRLFLDGNGRLDPQAPPAQTPASRYLFDPSDPVPTIGAGVQSPLFPGLIQGGGFDQRGRRELWACRDTRLLAERPDVLVFATDPLPEDLEVTGPVTVRLWVASSAPDTDFTAKLVDVYPPSDDWPAGFALNLSDGILRARYRNSRERAEPLRPGEPAQVVIELQATSNLFRAGHRLRLDVSSSNFPRFDLNPNTGEPLGHETRLERALNVVFHDAGRPSHLELPVVPR